MKSKSRRELQKGRQAAQPARPPSFYESIKGALTRVLSIGESESELVTQQSLSTSEQPEDEDTNLPKLHKRASAAVYAENQPEGEVEALQPSRTKSARALRESLPEPMRRGRVVTVFSDTRAAERQKQLPLAYRILSNSGVKIVLALFTLCVIGLIGGGVLRAIEIPIMAEKRAEYIALWSAINASGNATTAQLMALTMFGLPPPETAFTYWESMAESWQFVLSTCATIGCVAARTGREVYPSVRGRLIAAVGRPAAPAHADAAEALAWSLGP